MGLDILIEAAPELLAGFFDFLINFARKPIATLEPYQGKGKIDSKLISYVSLSAGLSIVIALIARAVGVAEDPSQTLAFIRSFEPEVLPIVVIVLILGITILFHIAARGYISLIYFPAALSATHPNTSFIQAAIALSASVTVVYLLGDLLARDTWPSESGHIWDTLFRQQKASSCCRLRFAERVGACARLVAGCFYGVPRPKRHCHRRSRSALAD